MSMHKRDRPCRTCEGTGQMSTGLGKTQCYACKGSGKAVDNYEHPARDAEILQGLERRLADGVR